MPAWAYQPLLFPDEVWRVWAEQMGVFGVLAQALRARSAPAAPPPGWRSAHDDQPSQVKGLDRT